MPSKLTLEQVAAVAGVSRATVSRVVNGSPKVAADVRAKVQRTIAELGYVPNRAARNLATSKSGLVAIVMTEPESFLAADPLFSVFTRAASAVFAQSDLLPVLLHAHGPGQIGQLEQVLAHGHFDGMIVTLLGLGDAVPAGLTTTGVPLVLGGRPANPIEGVPFVDVDNVTGGRLAARCFVESNRTTPATITGPVGMTASDERVTGFRSELEAAGVVLRDDLVIDGRNSIAGAAAAMAEILEREPSVDAVFASSDSMADAAMTVLRRSGRNIPGDVAVIGFNDTPLAATTDPALTSIREPMVDFGTVTASLLLSMMRGEKPDSPDLLPVELIRRDSA